MRKLDEKEVKIVKELVKNPRVSDNKIAKATKIAVMTVNRKRKQLEQEGLLNYFAYLDTSRYGTSSLPARQLYIVKFKIGITKKTFIEEFKKEMKTKTKNTEYFYESFLGERDGQLIWSFIMDGGQGKETMEIFNGKIVPMLELWFGKNCIIESFSFRLTTQLRLLHNYIPLLNMENGVLKKGYPNEFIFVD
ncbi:MAG: Lrp/AsnC family transcriptional regulator [Nanoarchaeota archaeon]|nr:Lrp/AsnC family transcriptional regulator [Nanoarchaeota archaeon]MBU1445515.1 Lrp/AsnC family transcriptional regulator [Nanoarchaeota archaeon]MBU2407000.1 Lrp/AsnC family transcriptional regulator [Nanoarchaeota archaeon]MBU2420614.1 Lrp/AsnC family transcriptional regulator [Nanoarchaeota archaeon]MBU2474938.1 Lrp/AsnC family transcriptional regulator [Nanoarchaeota archaeon]